MRSGIVVLGKSGARQYNGGMQPAGILHVEHVRNLVTADPPRPGAPAHLAAASGIVRVGDRYVIAADDEDALGVFPVEGMAPGDWLRLTDRVLPSDEAARKAVKLDIESLALLPDGAIIAVGSGSKPTRCAAMVLSLDEPKPRVVDLAPLYAAITQHVKELNIEGSVVVGDALRLLQRGNSAAGISAFVDVDLAAFTRDRIDAGALRGVVPVELGKLHGVALGFTDASRLPDGRLLFSAAAEDTQNTYDDGECKGSAVGVADVQGRIIALHPVDAACKVEGIVFERIEHGHAVATLVADGDDPHHPAPMMRVRIPLP